MANFDPELMYKNETGTRPYSEDAQVKDDDDGVYRWVSIPDPDYVIWLENKIEELLKQQNHE